MLTKTNLDRRAGGKRNLQTGVLGQIDVVVVLHKCTQVREAHVRNEEAAELVRNNL